MAVRKVALIVFYDKNNRILLQDRKKISKRGAEWGFFGGEIKERETPEEAVIRETEEELKYKLSNFEYIGNYKNTLDDAYIIDRYIFVFPLGDKLSKFVLNEREKMQLFSIEEAKKLKMVSGDYETLDIISKYLSVAE